MARRSTVATGDRRGGIEWRRAEWAITPPCGRAGSRPHGHLQLEVPEQLDLVWKIGIRTGVDAAELATFARIEPARGHIDILRLDLEQSALPLPGGRCGCLK